MTNDLYTKLKEMFQAKKLTFPSHQEQMDIINEMQGLTSHHRSVCEHPATTFDRLTEHGYKLNLITFTYYKP